MRIPTDSHAPHTAQRVRAVYGGSGLTPQGKLLAGLLTVLLLLGAGVALAMADAFPTLGARVQNAAPGAGDSTPARLGSGTTRAGAETLPASVVSAKWDGPATHLDWSGAEYARAETTFIGDRRASPGDRVVRTLNIVNAGPGAGVAAVTFDLSEVVPQGAQNPDLAEDVTLFWNIAGVTGEETFAALNKSTRVSVAEVAVAQGATVPVTVGFAMDAAVESSNASGADSTLLSFDVGVNVTGESEPPAPPTLAITGATGIMLLIGIGVALLLLGLLLFLARRKQRRDDDLLLVGEEM